MADDTPRPSEEGNEHTTGAGGTPPRRVMRSASEETPGRTVAGPVDTMGSAGDPQGSGEGPAIAGLDEAKRADERPADDEPKE